MRPAGGTYRACTPETAPAPKRIAARALHKESGTSPERDRFAPTPARFRVRTDRPLHSAIDLSTRHNPAKDDPPRFGCSPPTAGGTSRTPAKCTPPHRLRTATDPATKAKNTGTARPHPNRAQSHHPAAPRMPNPSAAGYGGRRRASFAWKAEGHPAPPQYAPLRRRFRRTSSALFKIGDKNILKITTLQYKLYSFIYIFAA